MIFPGTLLKVADNSGAKIVNCVQVMGAPWASEGDFVIVSVRKSRVGKRIQKGKIYKALVVQCRRLSARVFGHRIGFRSNRVVLLRRNDGKKQEVTPLATRIAKVVSFSVRKKGYSKILLLSPGQL